MMYSRIFVLLILSICLFLNCSRAKNDSPIKTNQFTLASGFFYGVENDKGEIGMGRLLYFDDKTKRCALYNPPYGIEKFTVKSDSLGNLSFSSIPGKNASMIHSFSGKLEADGVTGTFVEIIEDTKKSYTIKFQSFFAKTMSTLPALGKGAIFSNIRYNEESGDLLGDELLLFSSSKGLKALLTTAEGDAYGPDEGINIKYNSDTIYFSIPRIPSDSLCRVIMTSHGAKIQRYLSNSFGEASLLKRIGTIPDFFEAATKD